MCVHMSASTNNSRAHWPLAAGDKDSADRWSGYRRSGSQDNFIMGSMVEQLDQSVGQVAATLRRHHIDHDTVLAFSSDHEFHFEKCSS